MHPNFTICTMGILCKSCLRSIFSPSLTPLAVLGLEGRGVAKGNLVSGFHLPPASGPMVCIAGHAYLTPTHSTTSVFSNTWWDLLHDEGAVLIQYVAFPGWSTIQSSTSVQRLRPRRSSVCSHRFLQCQDTSRSKPLLIQTPLLPSIISR